MSAIRSVDINNDLMTLIHPRHTLRSSLQIFLFLILGVQAHSQSSPIGDWDFVMKGRQRGVAHITIYPDGTLAGRAVHTLAQKSEPEEGDAALLANSIGGAQLEGGWIQNGPANRIIGYINFSAPADSPGTSANGISFRGVVSGTRLILRARSFGGRITFRGMPLVAAADLSGGYFSQGRTKGARSPFVEIFTLLPMTSSDDGSVIPNSYFVTGSGPGYNYEGWLLVSGFKTAALSQYRDDDGESVAAFAGPFRTEMGRGTLTGTDGVNRNIRLSISHEP